MHTGRAGAHYDSVQLVVVHSLTNNLLTLLGAHIFIISSKGHIRHLTHSLHHRGNIHRAGDIAATPTNKNTYFLHEDSSYLLYFLKAATKAC